MGAVKKNKFDTPEQAQWLPLFLEFISHLTIDSKEDGVGPLKLYGSQRRFLAELIEGLDRGIHEFYNLKAMQLGISTVALAIDLFWLAVHPGMQGLLLTDTDGNRQKFRVIIKRFVASLPSAYKIKIKKGGDNREHIVFENGSVLDFIVAGTRKTATEIGRSRAYNFVHATETANYGAIEGVVSLLARLAEKHPHRLYLFESTAKGFNLFYKLWEQAKLDPLSKKAFFIGWWAKEDYSIEQSDPRFEKYWDGTVDAQEQERINNVWAKYGHRITPEQIVWYRWKFDSSADSSLMDQDFPWDEDDAFLQTGSTFFPVKKMVAIIQNLSHNPPPFKGYTYDFSPIEGAEHQKFTDTRLLSVKTAEESQLKIYEEPSPIGQYVMGVDPAYGRSENKDRTVVTVCRCYADRLVQVAEFASSDPESYQCAWVLAHLAGTYKNVMVILEITGPGEAAKFELDHLRQLFDAGALPTPAGGGVEDLFGGARWYMYHRADSPGPGYQYHWKASSENTQTVMNQLRDSVALDMVEVRSIGCAIEIQSMVQDGFRIEPSVSSDKDDRVYGLAYAHRAWIQWVRPAMISNGETWESVTEMERNSEEGSHSTMVSHIISEFFQQKDDDREEDAIEKQWD